jgi:ribosome modulation factor
MSDHNGGATDGECSEALREYRRQKRVCDEDNGVLRSIVKRWKAAGVPIPALIATAKATKRDPDEVVAEFASTVRMMHIARIPVTRESLFPEHAEVHFTEASEHETDMWEAEDRGYRAGRTNVPVDDCPYALGTEAQVMWQQWWHNGQASIARELGENARQADSSRQHPTRDPGTTVEAVEQSMAGGVSRRGRGRPKKAAADKAPRRRRAREANGATAAA